MLTNQEEGSLLKLQDTLKGLDGVEGIEVEAVTKYVLII